MTALILAGLLLSPHIDPVPPRLLPAKQIPLLVNPYDPALGGINCDHDCTRFGNGVEIQDWHYGIRMACNPAHIGCQFHIWNDFGSIGPVWCVESGGALLEPQYHEGFGRVVQYVDILWHLDDGGQRVPNENLPWWNHGVFEDYEIDCNWHE
jgi:hypothetical protein